MRNLVSLLCLTLCLWSSLTSSAQQSFSLDGIDYLLYDNGSATVTRIYRDSYYKTTVIVPSIIDDKYSVTTFGAGSPVFGMDWFEGGYVGDDNPKWYEDPYFLEFNVSNLKAIKLPESLTEIGKLAFWGCNGLSSIEIPGSVCLVDSCAFDGCNSLKEVHTPDVKKWQEINYARAEDNPLWSAHQLYENGEKVTELTLYHTWLNNIGDYAFAGWDGTEANFIRGVQQIGKGAFQDCRNLESVCIESWFADSIGALCFDCCTNLKNVELPRELKKVGYLAFQECISLKSIKLPYYVEVIGHGAFWMCDSLEEVNIPSNVTEIEQCAFGYSGIKSINIPNGVKRIGELAFWGCDSLSTVSIPSSVDIIERAAFGWWDSRPYLGKLKSVTFEDTDSKLIYDKDICTMVLFGPSLLFGPNNIIEEMYIGRDLDEAIKESMCNLPKLKTLEFGDYVTEILPDMFSQDAAIEDITIGGNVKSIGENVFAGSDVVKTVQVHSEVPVDAPLSSFSTNAYRNATLYVPDGSLSLYANHPTWSNFTDIREYNGTTSVDVLESESVPTIIAKSNAIVVSGAERVQVFNMSGVEVYCGPSGTIELAPGIYVVIADGVKQKIRIYHS